MTDPIHPDAPLPKAPPPGLSTRAPRPTAVRLRKSVVQVVVIGAAALLSGSLAWAFVVQPELRANARERVEEGRLDEARGTVRPADMVTGQPSSYDRLTPGDQLPEPRTRSGESEPAVAATRVTDRVRSPDYGYAAAAAPSAPRGRSVAQEAAGSGLFLSLIHI